VLIEEVIPDKSSQAAGQVFEPDRPHKSLHVLGRRPKTKTLVTGLKAGASVGHAFKNRCARESSQAGSIPVRLRVEGLGGIGESGHSPSSPGSLKPWSPRPVARRAPTRRADETSREDPHDEASDEGSSHDADMEATTTNSPRDARGRRLS